MTASQFTAVVPSRSGFYWVKTRHGCIYIVHRFRCQERDDNWQLSPGEIVDDHYMSDNGYRFGPRVEYLPEMTEWIGWSKESEMKNTYTITPPTDPGWYWIRYKDCEPMPAKFEKHDPVDESLWIWAIGEDRDLTSMMVADGYLFGPRIADPEASTDYWQLTEEARPHVPHGVTLDQIDIEAMIAKAVGCTLETIIVERVEVKMNRDTLEFTGELRYRLMATKERFIITFTGTRNQ